MHPQRNPWPARLGVLATAVVLSLSFGRLIACSVAGNHATALEVGRPAPAFTLPSAGGHTVDLTALRDKVVVLAYTSDRCPVSRQYAARFQQLVDAYAGDPRVCFFEISADVATGQLSPDQVRAAATDARLRHPLLIDTTGTFARAYAAELTPTFYVLGPGGILRYTGSFDDARNAPTAPHSYVPETVKRLLNGIPLTYTSTQTFGYPLPKPLG